jgi:hypothetical protein
MKLIETAQGGGGWVLPDGSHLMESWMPSLAAIVEQFNPDNMQTSPLENNGNGRGKTTKKIRGGNKRARKTAGFW